MSLPRVNPQVLVRQEPEETYVIHMGTGKIYRFNETALTIMEACQQGMGEEELLDLLMDQESDRGTVEEDVMKTLSRFRELELVE
ncbi:MAG: PqqD family protein [Theionarchaea archaeon]|nr:PqqD family protein [Theionarchaea archaeon]MBU6999593.1 PqqD family protein [Theionarchaea archaeon]MBU7020255.1 PqqD family protein [Theionarchaea archaeon]MBU7035642.1 PqqD family protein [Theionarchaea archaeon]MBU7041202.1 PqqD family protein [Theionarchaea archaeon]